MSDKEQQDKGIPTGNEQENDGQGEVRGQEEGAPVENPVTGQAQPSADQAEEIQADERDLAEEAELADEEERTAAAVRPEADKPKSGKGWMYVAIGLAVVLIVVLAIPKFGGGSGETMATVNGTKISKDQLYDAMLEQGGESTLNNLISDELLNQEAEKAGVTVTDADVEKEIANIKKNFPSEEEFNAALAQNGMTLESFKEQVPPQVKLRKILEPKSGVTDEQVKQYYEDNKASYDTQEQVQASHILVATKQEAEAILKQLNEGADFATLAKEKSTDTTSAVNGGDLGFFQKGMMVAAFEQAAFALKNPGDLSPIVETEHGFHIIKLTEHKAAKQSTFEENQTAIKDQLVNQKVSEIASTWIEEIRAKATITNKLEDEKKAEEEAATEGDAAKPAEGAGNAATKTE
ncbi:peptidylprolyl isomerase [Paenibacillus methanolicus]|uniref:Foldase protein PrsA n=1 Tax=Paenibacillus methanolicus TaxID=582686 RepID=A0A5S5CGS5_9BACL|nr:peptidylprolyl isomerase [Paenibacillus methanolicus]TYP77702.1 foldase protein PrsA [Paenibacillus methanolicus]